MIDITTDVGMNDVKEKLYKVKMKIARGAWGDNERKRRKLERKRFKLQRRIARNELLMKIILTARQGGFDCLDVVEEQYDAPNPKKSVVIKLRHAKCERILKVYVFDDKSMNNKTYDLESDSSLGSNPVVKVTIEDKGRRVYNRTVQLQDKEVIIDRVLLSHNPLLWDIQTLSESDRKAFETVKEALTAYLEAITPCTVRGLEGQDEDE